MAVMKRTRKRSGATTYFAQFDGPDGRKVTEEVVTLKCSATAADHRRAENKARTRADDRRVEVRNGTYRPKDAPAPKTITFGALLDLFLAERPNGGKGDDHYGGIQKPLRAAFGSTKATAITSAAVAAYAKAMAQPKDEDADPAAPATVVKHLNAIHRVFNWGVEHGHLPKMESPAGSKAVKRPRVVHEEARAYTPAEESAVQAALPAWAARVWSWAINTGMDRGEIFTVTEAAVRDDLGHVVAPRSKTGVRRVIPLNDTLRAILAEARAHREATRTAKVVSIEQTAEERAAMAAGDLIFLTETGSPIKARYFKKVLLKAMTRANVTMPRPMKQCRHTFATRLLDRGASPRTVAKLLGHSTLAVLDTYGHVSDRAAREAMDSLDAGSNAATPAATDSAGVR